VPPLVPRREHFTGPERLSPAWTLTKGRKKAACEIWLHEFGFELRLLIVGELVQSQVVCTQEDLLRVHESWRTALIEKGWTKTLT
jgi:hypothetical protein